ncbi:MAG: hypothetical protein WC256_02205 [Desulfurivibrionaceae bacterium]|jgi:hypothetical protein
MKQNLRRELTYYLTMRIAGVPMGATNGFYKLRPVAPMGRFSPQKEAKWEKKAGEKKTKKAESLFNTKAFRFQKPDRGLFHSACYYRTGK